MSKNSYIKVKKKYINMRRQEGNLYNIYFVGDYYYSFLKKNLKKYQFIEDIDGFNLSMCHLDKDRYIFSTRFLAPLNVYFGEPMIPGNYSSFSDEYIKKLNKKLNINQKKKKGVNFFWNEWDGFHVDNTVIFVGTYNKGKIEVSENITPYVFSNKKAFVIEGSKQVTYADIRIVKINGVMYIYDAYITSIYEVRIIDNKITIQTTADDNYIYSKYELYFKNKLCNSAENNCYKKIYDKNWSCIDIINTADGKAFEFLNWYDNGYVTNSIVNMKTGLCKVNNIIEMKKDVILKLGNKSMPMFSMGTNFLKLENKTSNVVYDGIAAGHIKIALSNYYDNKNIQLFFETRKLINNDQKINYIEHSSYIYLIYYIRLLKYKNGDYDMSISDGYLYSDTTKKYVFSICFPMSVTEQKDKIIVTYGYGDYYNCIFEQNIEPFLENIKHNIKEFDYEKYNFRWILNE